jgi:hypothetical protein
MTEATERPWRSCRPSHTTGTGWSVTLHNEPIPACRAIGITRGHALANAALISRAVIVNDRITRLLASKPEDHEDARRIVWLRQKLAE